jgi:hypothetical protein
MNVSTIGSYAALARGTGVSNWFIQMASFKAGSGIPATSAPTFSPASGTYNNTQTVTIADTTPGAIIYYTTDGSTPPNSPSTQTSTPGGTAVVSVAATGTTLKAMARVGGFQDSNVVVATYNLITATPIFSPLPGTYISTQSVTLSDATQGATIYYTIDGTTPTAASLVYSSPVVVSATTTIKAMATATGFGDSGLASGVYTINLPTTATPVFTPAGGTYNSTQSVTISDSTVGAVIYYTTDGTTPTIPPSGTTTQYSGAAIAVTTTGTTLKAIASASSNQNSVVASSTYNLVAATPTFSPAPGTYPSSQSVTLSDTTSGATIYYTTDGTTPTNPPSGTTHTYTGAISVSATTTIKAIAGAPGFQNSLVATGTYTIGIVVAPIALLQHIEKSVDAGTNVLSQAFPVASASGDLVLVAVKWGNSTVSVATVNDNKGNTYTSAVGPTNWSSNNKRAQVFYAKNIIGGGAPITITVTLSNNSTSTFHLYQFEYANADIAAPLDVTSAAIGSATTVSSGAVTTHYSNEMIFGWAIADSVAVNAGTGFTAESTFRGNLVEDMNVSTIGSYAALARGTGVSNWFIQMASFKAAGSP